MFSTMLCLEIKYLSFYEHLFRIADELLFCQERLQNTEKEDRNVQLRYVRHRTTGTKSMVLASRATSLESPIAVPLKIPAWNLS